MTVPRETASTSPDPRRYCKEMFGLHNKTHCINDWIKREEQENHGTGGALIPDTKLIVSKYALDSWLASGVGLDLKNFPATRTKLPNQDAEQIFDLIKNDYIGKQKSK